MAKIISDKTKSEDYYVCDRCEINSLTKQRMCPCPRGGCEARIAGTLTVTTTKTIDVTLTPEQEKWNKDNYR
jgi:hypothetical protein